MQFISPTFYLFKNLTADFLAFSIFSVSIYSTADWLIHFFPNRICAASIIIPQACKSVSAVITDAKHDFVFPESLPCQLREMTAASGLMQTTLCKDCLYLPTYALSKYQSHLKSLSIREL